MYRPVLILSAGLLVLPACSDLAMTTEPGWAQLDKRCPANAPVYDAPAVAQSGGVRTIDEIWAEIARQVPGGWGGLFYEPTSRASGADTQGPLTMYLVDPRQREAAVTALIRLLEREGMLVPGLSRAQVWQGRWDFAQLYDWYVYLNPYVWQVEGVTMTDIDESRNRIEYGVLDEAVRQRVVTLLNELDIPCFLVAVVIRPPTIMAGSSAGGG